MPEHSEPRPKRSWPGKFRGALSGVRHGIKEQSSFRVHFLFAVAVLIAGVLLNVSLIEWCLLLLCIAMVLAAETCNSALEFMAKAITDRENENLGTALNVSSGAVLVASIGAAVVGAVIFVYRLGVYVGWW